MALEKFTNKRVIKKVVDPGSGSIPGKISLPQEIKETREIAQISYTTAIEDLIDYNQQVAADIQVTINDIYERNKSSTYFVKYAQLVQENYFDPVILLTAPDAKPLAPHSSITIKSAERDVYRRLVDPRAPMYQDLHNMLFDLGSMKYVLESTWKGILNQNSLYDNIQESQVVRQVLERQEMNLKALAARNLEITGALPKQLGDKLINALANKIFSQARNQATPEIPSWINHLATTLNQIKVLLNLNVLKQSKEWEHIAQNLYKGYLDQLAIVTKERINAQIYSFQAGIQKNIGDFLNQIQLPDFDFDLADVPEFVHFQQSIQEVLGGNFGEIENDLISREIASLKSEESRSLLLHNVLKTTQVKQYLNLVGSIHSWLASAKLELSTSTQLSSTDHTEYVNKLSAAMKTASENFLNQVEWK